MADFEQHRPEAENVDAKNAQNAAKRPSEELKKFYEESVEPEKDNDAKEIDQLFDALEIKANTHKEQYESERLQAITALKKYIIHAYKSLEDEIRRTDSPELRQQWITKLHDVQKDVGNYRGIIAGFLTEFQRQLTVKNESIDLKGLWQITEHANMIYEQMVHNKTYGETLQKAVHNKLEKPDFDFIYGKIQKRTETGAANTNDSLKMLEQSGVAAIMAGMNTTERQRFAEYAISENKPEALAVVSSMVESNYLTMTQGEQLIEKAIAKGLMTADEKKGVLALMLVQQEKNAEFHKGIEARLDLPQFTNQMQRVLDPKFLGGLILTVWRSLNLFVTAVAYRKDPGELLGSPYFYADVVGIFAGTAMMGYPSVFEFLKRSTEGQKNQEVVMKQQAELMAKMNRYHGLSELYFEKGGMVEAIREVQKEHAKKGKSAVPTLEELKAESEKSYVKGMNPALTQDLQVLMNSGDSSKIDRVNQLIAQTYATTGIEQTKHYQALANVAKNPEKVTAS